MNKLSYIIKTLSPVLITQNVGDTNTVNTNEYIKGRAVLGIFASNFIKKNNLNNQAHLNDKFCRWFLDGNLRFSNAYIKKNGRVHFPAPLSIQEKKNGKEVFDLLFDNPKDKQTKSPGGFICIEDNMIKKTSVKKSLNFHHARDPETGTTKEGQIFNYEAIDWNQIFEGNISGRKEDLEEFIDFFGTEFTTYTGRSKMSQYGKILIQISDKTTEFDFGPDNLQIDDNTISMTLLSDLIIYNDEGFSTTDVDVLESQTGFKIEKAFIKTGEIENFVSIWGLRRPSEVCFLGGSTFLLKVSESDKTELIRLQKTGIGERRYEGYGRVLFGSQVKKNKYFPEDKKDDTEIPRPAVPLPDITREIMRKTLKDLAEKHVKLNALKDASKFTRHLPSKSLIGRLEAMAKKDKGYNLSEKLKKLRNTATDKLKRCRSDNETLLDFLDKYPIKLEDIFKNERIKKLASEISFSPKSDDLFSKKLYEIYFRTFFASLRKKANKKKGE